MNYDVFISSTFNDLKIHRDLILHVLARLKKKVQSMEYFGARTENSLKESMKAVNECDIFIGILGTRYGTVRNEKSISHWEYLEAFKNEKTIFIYLIDEDNHFVLPKFIDKGKKAKKLKELKNIVQKRHICSSFSSAEDLALKIGIDLLDFIDKKERIENKTIIKSELKLEISEIFVNAGFSYGLTKNKIDVSDFILVKNNRVNFADERVSEILSATKFALQFSDGNFGVLDGIITFDKNEWHLILKLVEHFGIKEDKLINHLENCDNPFQFRILLSLVGELNLKKCIKPICKIYLYGNLETKIREINEPIRSIRDALVDSLSKMSVDIIPIVEYYENRAKEKKTWRKKKAFEKIIDNLNKQRSQQDLKHQ